MMEAVPKQDNQRDLSTSHTASVLSGLPVFSGIVVSLLGISVIFGWLFHNAAIIQIHPSFVPMQFNTALCFLFSGLGLVALNYNYYSAAKIMGSVVFLFGALTILEYITNTSFGLDTLLYTPYMVTEQSTHIGRMATSTATSFALCGMLLLMWSIKSLRSYHFPSAMVCVAVLTLSFAALMGYVLQVESTYSWGSFSRMAAHTAAGFLILGSGLSAMGWKVADRPSFAAASLVIPVALATVILVMDLISRMGIVVPMLYIFVVLCGLAIQNRHAPFLLAGVASFLTLLAYFNLPVDQVVQVHISVNRMLAVVTQWVVAFIVYFIKGAYNELQNSRDQMQSTLHNVFGAIITIDTKGAIKLFNPMAERVFGYSAAEVLGKNINMLMPEPYHSNHDSYLSNYLQTGTAKIIGSGREVIGLRKDGTEFPLELGVSKAEINGRPIFVGLLHDITARKNAEEDVKRRTEDLEHSNKELDDFAYIASHDLKEPLRGIHNYASFLLEDYQDKLDDDGKEKLKTLTVLTQRLETLIDSLLYYSRVGRGEMTSEVIDMNVLLDNIIFSLKPSFEEKQVEVRIVNKLPAIQCDAVHVGEVFRNLITNAAKYNDKDEKWVEVGCREAFEVKQPVFYVRDNGIGIPEKHQESVFRIFKRLHARNKFGGGTGSGLTIAKKIVERHGGQIWIESEVDKGTTFYFTLSRGEKHEQHTGTQTASSDVDSGGQQRGFRSDGTRVA